MGMKRVICAALVAVCCLGQLTVGAAESRYPDWAKTEMERWEACGKLDPTISAERGGVTRGQFAVLLDGVMPYTEQAENRYADLKGDEPYAAAMLRLAKAGILQGAGGLMRPAAGITRQEVAVLVARAFGIQGVGAPEYRDVADIAPWAANAVRALQEQGIMEGSDNLFDPTREMTYAELVVVLDHALQQVGTITGLEVHARHETGVLAQGQPAQVNDGKFAVLGVSTTVTGYRVEVRGLAPLVGQQADADGAGMPAKAGKWMGIQLKISGLITAGDMQISQQAGTWVATGSNGAFAPAHMGDSLMIYLNGSDENSAAAAEQERTVSLEVRNSYGGDKITVEFHFIPA